MSVAAKAPPHRGVTCAITHGLACVWLMGLTVQAQTLPLPPTGPIAAQVNAGFNIILDRQQGNCLTCHTLSATNMPPDMPKELGQQGNFGPSLDGVGARHSQASLLQWVTDARKIKPNTLMPPYGSVEALNQPNMARPLLTPEQLQAVATALSSLR